MYSLVSRIDTSTGDKITLINNSRESIASARNKALGFILRNGGKGKYCIYQKYCIHQIGEEEMIAIEAKEIIRIDDEIILRRTIDCSDEFK